MSSTRKSKLTIIDDPAGWTEHAPGEVKRPESVTLGWPRYLAWIGPGLYVGHSGLAEAIIEARRHGGLVYEPLALTTAELIAAKDALAAARADAERLRAALAIAEWGGGKAYGAYGPIMPCCPVCRGVKPGEVIGPTKEVQERLGHWHGHKADCALLAALTRKEAPDA